MEAEFTRKSIPTRLREAGVEFEESYDERMGAIRFVIDGEALTPGEAERRYLKAVSRA